MAIRLEAIASRLEAIAIGFFFRRDILQPCQTFVDRRCYIVPSREVASRHIARGTCPVPLPL